jgi:hypothetical protein
MKKIISSGKLEKKLGQFDKESRRTIFSNIRAMQLTEGCSTGCTDCGLGAARGVKDYIPFNIIADLFFQYNNEWNKESILYFASDPFDYDFEGKNYVDVHSSFQKNTGNNPCVTTSIPMGKEELIFSHIFEENDLNRGIFINSISLTEFNYKRVEKKMMALPYFKEQKKYAGRYRVGLSNGEEISSSEGRVKLQDVAKKFRPSMFSSFSFRDFVNGRNRIDFGAEDKSNIDFGGLNDREGYLVTPTGIYFINIVKPDLKFPYGQDIRKVTPDNIHDVTFIK